MLSVPFPRFAESGVQHNLTATPSATMAGTTITGGAANTKGSWSSLIDPVNFDTYMVMIHIGETHVATTNTRALVDIGIGPTGGGSEQVILPDLLAGSASTQGFSGGAYVRGCILPLFIPDGVRISARIAGVQASKTAVVTIWLWGGPMQYPWGVCTGATAYGITAASSQGTAITAGNTGAESAWTSVGGTTSKDHIGFFGMCQVDSNTAKTALAYHWEFGWSSTTMHEMWVRTHASEGVGGPPTMPVFQPIPSGTQMQARGECSGTAEALDIAIYGLN